MFELAPQPDIVRSSQKDDYCVQQLRDNIHMVVGSLYNNNIVSKYDNELDLLSSSIYYGITTLANKKTIGEEYCDLLQVKTKYIASNNNNNDNKQQQTNNITNTTTQLQQDNKTKNSTSNVQLTIPTPPSTPRNSTMQQSTTTQQQRIASRGISSGNTDDKTFISSTSSNNTINNNNTNKPNPLKPRYIYHPLNTKYRATLVAIQLLLPYIYNKLRRQCRPIHDYNNNTNRIKQHFISLYNKLLNIVVNSDNVLMTLSQLHLALFYLLGNYYDIYKRLCNIQYIVVRKLDIERAHYSLLGLIILLQLSLVGLHKLCIYTINKYNQWSENRRLQQQGYLLGSSDDNINEQHPDIINNIDNSDNISTVSSIDTDSDIPSCSLCLSPLDDTTTTTECGHLYHWTCIAEALNNTAQCPLCRQPCVGQQLILLAHYI